MSEPVKKGQKYQNREAFKAHRNIKRAVKDVDKENAIKSKACQGVCRRCVQKVKTAEKKSVVRSSISTPLARRIANFTAVTERCRERLNVSFLTPLSNHTPPYTHTPSRPPPWPPPPFIKPEPHSQRVAHTGDVAIQV